MKGVRICLMSLVAAMCVAHCQARTLELPLPEIPDSLVTPESRADFLTAHFWDSMDFSDHSSSLDSAYMEQNFVNFVNLYDYCTPSGAEYATANLMCQAGQDGPAYLFLLGIAEKYLYYRDSPMFDEERFILFLRHACDNHALPERETARYGYLLECALKNRPGMVAADFAFVDSDAVDRTLHTASCAPHIILIFYDPDCESCRSVVVELGRDTFLNGLIDRGLLAVIAIDAEEDKNLWARTKSQMPERWITGFDTTGIIDKELYVFSTRPAVYLLDGDKTVVLKDTDLSRLHHFLDSEYPQE